MLDELEGEATKAETKTARELPALRPENPDVLNLRAFARFRCDVERLKNEAAGRSGGSK